MPCRGRARLTPRRAPVAGTAPIALRDKRDKSTQRDRLLAAIVSVSGQHGFEDATVAQVIGHAGVSRPTFYEYFASKEVCFVAALEQVERDVLAVIERSIEERPAQIAAAAAITALVTFAQEHPAEARLLTHESMAAGRKARDARDHGIEQIAQLIEDAYRHLNAATQVPALPSEILIGTTYRLLAVCLVRGEHAFATLQADLLDWLEAYRSRSPAAQRRWRTLTPAPAPARSPYLGRAPLRAPPAL
jgi:AcrR family transcriptional regulator